MKLYFAIDLSKGQVVRGSKGEREKYKPVGSLQQVLNEFKPKRLYIADLDRIEGKGDNLKLIEEIADSYDVIADLGFREPEEVKEFNFTPIIATETFDLGRIHEVKGDFYVSLDFKGEFLGGMDLDSALEILNTLKTVVIVLTVDRVGTLNPNFELVDYVLSKSENPVMVGGGVRNVEDLERLKEMGCSGAIVATAVYKGLIPLSFIRSGSF